MIDIPSNKKLFIQFEKKEYLEALVGGQFRITQQMYYRYVRGESADSEDGLQLVKHQDGVILNAGAESTYIWSASLIGVDELGILRRFKGSDYGLLIDEPERFMDNVVTTLKRERVLRDTEIEFGEVIYHDGPIDSDTESLGPFCRWVKRERFKDEYEVRLSVHNVPPIGCYWEKYFSQEDVLIESRYTPFQEVPNKQEFYALVFRCDFKSDYRVFVHDGKRWVLDES